MPTNNFNNQVPLSHASTEIDIFELLSMIWKKKRIIFFSVLVCLVITLAYTFLSVPEWRTKAYITAPNLQQFKQLFDLEQEYTLILDRQSETDKYLAKDIATQVLNILPNGVLGVKNDFERQKLLASLPYEKDSRVSNLSTSLFGNFILLLTSFEVQKAFFEHNDYIQKKLANLKDEKTRKNWLNKFITDNLVIAYPDNRSNSNNYILTLKTDDPNQSVELLKEFLFVVNQQALDLTSDQFKDKVQAEILSLQQKIKDFELKVKFEKQQEIDAVNLALTIARQAGIKEPFGTKDINQSNLFLLGEKLLNIKLDNEKKSALVYPHLYYQLNKQLSDLQKLANYEIANAQLFRFELTPQTPIIADGVSLSVKLILAIVAGLLLGMLLLWGLYSKQLYDRWRIM